MITFKVAGAAGIAWLRPVTPGWLRLFVVIECDCKRVAARVRYIVRGFLY